MKNSSDTIGNQSRDLPACSALPQPTAPPAAWPPALQVGRFILGEKAPVPIQLEPGLVPEPVWNIW